MHVITTILRFFAYKRSFILMSWLDFMFMATAYYEMIQLCTRCSVHINSLVGLHAYD